MVAVGMGKQYVSDVLPVKAGLAPRQLGSFAAI
jgi:hypothetical protein